MINEEELRFNDDKIYCFTPLPQYGDGVCRIDLVMTKEIFIECYKKWIKPQVESDGNEDERSNISVS